MAKEGKGVPQGNLRHAKAVEYGIQNTRSTVRVLPTSAVAVTV